MTTTMTAAQKKAEKIRARKAHSERMAALREQGIAVVAAGKCPECGAGIHRNITITGWWQCDRSGAPGFRRDMSGSQCGWQVIIPQ